MALDGGAIKAEGLFYGGGFTQLGLQIVGMAATIAWTIVTITITFLAIKHTLGLRVSAEEELQGLDSVETWSFISICRLYAGGKYVLLSRYIS